MLKVMPAVPPAASRRTVPAVPDLPAIFPAAARLRS
jgi:hypothetical protein